jgi:hypothetical protein
MRSFLPIRIFRLTLAISVSLWMAGAGCLLGCSNTVNAAPHSKDDVNTVVADDSCASKHSHHCCAKKKQPAPSVETQLLVPEIRAVPGSMKDCPLAVSASAVVSKARSDGSNDSLQHQVSVAVPEQSNSLSKSRSSESLLLNRGPTYLRCCVFLI